jgi:uncharacterized protein (UPF0248 family)
MKTRAVLNRITWDKRLKDQQDHFTITFIHRGAPDDEKTILFKQITKVLAAYFLYKDDETGEEVQIPFHRIMAIKNTKRGTYLYVKKNHPEDDFAVEELPPDEVVE